MHGLENSTFGLAILDAIYTVPSTPIAGAEGGAAPAVNSYRFAPVAPSNA